MRRPSRRMLLYGTEETPPPARLIVAGPFSAELERGNLRYVRLGDVELLRGISFLVRSRTWATLEPDIADLLVSEAAPSFHVTYRATVRDGDAVVTYRAQIEGTKAGVLTFRCTLEAVTDFETCRAGFVVLHPAEVAGRPVQIEHADGGIEAGIFPLIIDPVQPMTDVRALTHAAAAGLVVTCRMDGDVFEMEDQRNWTDASFKTYVRPLSRPWPHVLVAGTRVEQSVTLRTTGWDMASPIARRQQSAQIEIGEAAARMPALGLGCTPDEARIALPKASRLREVGFSVLVARFDAGLGHRAADLDVLRDLAAATGSDIELQVVTRSVEGYAAELLAVAEAVRARGLVLRAVAVSPAPDLKSTTPGQPWPDCPPLDALYQAARAAFPGVPLGGGTFAYFTELNRKRPPAHLLDFVTFSTSPLVHAADDRSVMESLQSLEAVALSVRALAGGTPYAVGPSCIAMRDNPYGSAPLPNPDSGRVPMSGADPRQHGLFNAAWTVGYISRFAVGGAARIAVSAPAGPCGIMDANRNFPVSAVVRGCSGLHGAVLRPLRGVNPSMFAGFLAEAAGRRELWLANLTPEKQAVMLPDVFPGFALQRVDEGGRWVIDDTLPARQVLHLDAFDVVRCVAPMSVRRPD